jgi:hypothetical protein
MIANAYLQGLTGIQQVRNGYEGSIPFTRSKTTQTPPAEGFLNFNGSHPGAEKGEVQTKVQTLPPKSSVIQRRFSGSNRFTGRGRARTGRRRGDGMPLRLPERDL